MTTNQPKKIVYESRFKLIGLLIIGWGFVLMCSLTGYITGLVFFGLCAIATTYPLIDPKKKIIFIGTTEYKEHIKKEFQKKRVDHGIFTYSQEGFTIKISGKERDIAWTSIQSIFGYKVDQYALDEICMDVFCDNSISFTITEETAGWYVFLDNLSDKFPSIKGSWDIEIAVPAFATNLTLLYEKHHMTLEEATRYYYKNPEK